MALERVFAFVPEVPLTPPVVTCWCVPRWKEAVTARKKLRRQMRTFPAAPCCVDVTDQLRALAPSAECPIAEGNLARNLLNLGHAGKVGISCTRSVLGCVSCVEGPGWGQREDGSGLGLCGTPARRSAHVLLCFGHVCACPETLGSWSLDLVGIPRFSPGLSGLRTHHVHSHRWGQRSLWPHSHSTPSASGSFCVPIVSAAASLTPAPLFSSAACQ